MKKENRILVHMLITAFMGIATTFITSHFVNKNLSLDLGALVIFSSTVYYLMFLTDDDKDKDE